MIDWVKNTLSSHSGQICPAAKLSGEARVACAFLAMKALPDLYLNNHVTTVEIADLLAEEIADVGGELSGSIALLRDGEVQGILAAYDAAEIAVRQQNSIYRLLSAVDDEKADDLLVWFEAHRAEVPETPIDSYYLARIAVATDCRCRGVGKLLLDQFMEQGRSRRGFSLHVRSDNEVAKSFYRKHGFATIGTVESRYLVMYRQ